MSLMWLENKTDISISSELCAAIKNHIPAEIAFCCEKISSCEGDIYEEESRFIRNAVSKRKLEYRAGRVCARAALAKINYPACSIPTGKNRSPIWPSEISGSISHDGDYSIASVALRNDITHIGVDLVVRQWLDSDLAKLICSKEEIMSVSKILDYGHEIDPLLLIFSVKESVYKCLYPIVQEIFDFKDVYVGFDSQGNNLDIRMLNTCLPSNSKLMSTFCAVGKYVMTLVWINAIREPVSDTDNF